MEEYLKDATVSTKVKLMGKNIITERLGPRLCGYILYLRDAQRTRLNNEIVNVRLSKTRKKINEVLAVERLAYLTPITVIHKNQTWIKFQYVCPHCGLKHRAGYPYIPRWAYCSCFRLKNTIVLI